MQASPVVLTGASGSGKTTLAHAFRARYGTTWEVFCFDTIGVPPVAEMLERYGTGHQPGGAWQRAMTLEWMTRVAGVLRTGRPVLFEGQMRPAFVVEALAACGISRARLVLVDCDDAVRVRRLTEDRRQPELADANMLNWASYLREEARALGFEVLDTGRLSVMESVDMLLAPAA